MKNGHWMTAKEVLRVNAFKWPNKIGIKDLYKAYTFKQWNERSCRLANALARHRHEEGRPFCRPRLQLRGMDGDLAAAAKGGFICVPLMFRLSRPRRWNTTSTTVSARFSSFRAEKTGTGKNSPG